MVNSLAHFMVCTKFVVNYGGHSNSRDKLYQRDFQYQCLFSLQKASEKCVNRAMQITYEKYIVVEKMAKQNMIAQINKHHINPIRTETHD